MLQRLARVDHTILVLNLLLLLTIVVLPFSTSLMAAYLNATSGENIAAVVYGGSFLAMSLAFFAIQRHMLITKRHLLHEHLTPAACQDVLRRNAVGLMPYAIAHDRRNHHSLPHPGDLRGRRRLLRTFKHNH